MMFTRLTRSARRAMGMPPNAYSNAKAVPPRRPNSVSVSLRSSLIAEAMIEMMLRSIELNVYAAISSSVTRRLYAAEKWIGAVCNLVPPRQHTSMSQRSEGVHATAPQELGLD